MSQLEQRGLLVTDRDKALEHLERIGYYRLSGYWFAMRERSGVCCPLDPTTGRKPAKVKTETLALDSFKPEASFQNAVDLYVFDKKLRLLVLDALERIEVALRVDVSHRLGRHDPFAYLKPELFHNSFGRDLDAQTGLTPHHAWLDNQARLINRSREQFIEHNRRRYGLPLAIWVACEVWDFGTLSRLYGGMKETDQDHISALYGISNGRVFATWLRSLNYLRNVCAHHSRLWNRNVIDQPKLPPKEEVPALAAFHDDGQLRARPFLLLCITHHLLKVINPASQWGHRFKTLLAEEFPDLQHLGLNLRGMGIDPDWSSRDW
ncbi:Abi family protein [Sphaerotilus sp.]|uniref:Abi family protein n=1 Tax=Sphaerotilus sp. TaxID=2093942 RepID=UPI002ACE1A57|nr:Abi family protein [Sphaerotilus sp.]MDZ7856429.1 Abi family protein [Sphaerotilus sp.]